MNKLFILFFFVLLTFHGFCGVKVKAYSMAIKHAGTNWKWSEWTPQDIMVALDDDKITIYSKEIHSFDLKSKTETFIDKFSKNQAWKAVDQEGKKCTLQLSDNGGSYQLYIIYKEIQFNYLLK